MIDDPHAYQHREGDAHQWLCRFGIDDRHCVTGTTTKTAITERGGEGRATSGSLASLSWNTTDPYAITLLVHDDETGEAAEWVFARELLVDGGGIGDVRIRHGLVTSLELDAPAGSDRPDLTLRLSVTWVEHFLRYTQEVMPLGQEPSLVDVGELEWTTELEWLVDGRADI
jgi:sporulation and cell division protein SsgA